MLSLGRIPLPRIGSFALDNEGVLSLSNRPLTLQIHQLENEGIPTDIDRDITYPAIESYLHDLLALHDNRLRYQPNSINDEVDCEGQLAVLTAMRSLLPHFIQRDRRYGPFRFTLTDIHMGNIFVRHTGHIACLIDLEWACCLPTETWHPPYWLTNRHVDQLIGDHLAPFNEMRVEFMNAFEHEERLLSQPGQDRSPYTTVMNKGWENGMFFYFHALDNLCGLSSLFYQHIQPMFARSHLLDPALEEAFQQIFSRYWATGVERFVSMKVDERQRYDETLQRVFNQKIEANTLDV